MAFLASFIHALDTAGISFMFTQWAKEYLPLYALGLGWVVPALIGVCVGLLPDELGQANIADDKAKETHRRRNLFVGHGGEKFGEVVGKGRGQADGGGETCHQHRKTQDEPAHGTEERGGQGVEQGAAVGEGGGGDGPGIGEHKIHHGQKQGGSNAAEHRVFYNALFVLHSVAFQGVDDNDGKGQSRRAVQGQIPLHHAFEEGDGAVVLLGSAQGAVGDGGGVHGLGEQAAQEDHQNAEEQNGGHVLPYHVHHLAGIAAEIVGEGEEAPGKEQGEDPGVLLEDVGQQGQLKGGASGAGHGKQGANEQIDAHGETQGEFLAHQGPQVTHGGAHQHHGDHAQNGDACVGGDKSGQSGGEVGPG